MVISLVYGGKIYEDDETGNAEMMKDEELSSKV